MQILLIFFALLTWSIATYSCGLLAERYGRSFGKYFCFSFFLSPALGYIFLLSKGVKSKSCPSCFENIRAQATKCHYCDHNFSVKKIEAAATSSQIKSKITFEEYSKLDELLKLGKISQAEYDEKKKAYYAS